MKLSAIAAVVAGVASASAVPLRVVVIPAAAASDVPTRVGGVRFGHAVGLPPAVASIVASEEGRPGHPGQGMRRPCGGRGGAASRFREKAVEISNAFRHALGLPIIDTDHKPHFIYKSGPFPHMNPYSGDRDMNESPPFIQAIPGTKNGWITVTRVGPDHPHPPPPGPPPHHHHHHDHHRPGPHPFRFERPSFMARLHFSLMNLGPWEGRAVAFVLGCGIGVLLRMFWVLALVTYRAVKSRRQDEHEYTQVAVIETFVEPIALPPTYVYPIDEKAALEPEPTKAAEESK